MKKNILASLCIFLVYFIIDVSYQIAIGMKQLAGIYEQAGLTSVFTSNLKNPILLPLWFALMTYALLILVVNPAIHKRSVGFAATRGLLLGLISYGTLAFVNGWTIEGYPMTAVYAIVLEGIIFPTISASVTTWLFIRKS